MCALPGVACSPKSKFEQCPTDGKDSFIVLMIRLARVGARKQPHYRVVVIEKDRARNGRSVEVVGTYNPRTSPASVDLKLERVEYWKGKGAQLSDRVAKLLASAPSSAGLPPAPAKPPAGESDATAAA
jgi:small subunit ribosomal protein S16